MPEPFAIRYIWSGQEGLSLSQKLPAHPACILQCLVLATLSVLPVIWLCHTLAECIYGTLLGAMPGIFAGGLFTDTAALLLCGEISRRVLPAHILRKTEAHAKAPGTIEAPPGPEGITLKTGIYPQEVPWRCIADTREWDRGFAIVSGQADLILIPDRGLPERPHPHQGVASGLICWPAKWKPCK